jgi:DNA-directed RNA polymerase subunit M/transcription elongation factor TFIIS
MTMYFNACPKCRGTVVRREDDFGTYLQCLSCSRIIELAQPNVADRPRPRLAQKKAA